MTTFEIPSRFVRVVAGLHGAAAVYLFFPRDPNLSPLLPATVAGCGVFAYALFFTRRLPVKEVFLRGYAGPITAIAATYLLWNSPTNWEQAGALLQSFAAGVVLGPHPFVYLACLAYACLSAERPKAPGLYR
ncbi:MAG: hypothetical protein U0804_01215 [Gemmataceae bacterium]